jgi:hypothetical protein
MISKLKYNGLGALQTPQAVMSSATRTEKRYCGTGVAVPTLKPVMCLVR